MIAHIKVVKNAKEIVEIQEFNAVITAKQNDPSAKPSKKAVEELELTKKEVPAPIYGLNEMSLIETDITLAYINTHGEISVQYLGQTFVLEYEHEAWETIKSAMELVAAKKISALKAE